MSEVEEALLDAVRLEADEDVLVLGGATLALGARKRVGNAWVYVVRREVDDLVELLAEAHAVGATGLAYLVGDAFVLPLPDSAVAAAVASSDGASGSAAAELARVLAAGGRVAVAAAAGPSADALTAALESAGFGEVTLTDVGDEVAVSGTRK